MKSHVVSIKNFIFFPWNSMWYKARTAIPQNQRLLLVFAKVCVPNVNSIATHNRYNTYQVTLIQTSCRRHSMRIPIKTKRILHMQQVMYSTTLNSNANISQPRLCLKYTNNRASTDNRSQYREWW